MFRRSVCLSVSSLYRCWCSRPVSWGKQNVRKSRTVYLSHWGLRRGLGLLGWHQVKHLICEWVRLGRLILGILLLSRLPRPALKVRIRHFVRGVGLREGEIFRGGVKDLLEVWGHLNVIHVNRFWFSLCRCCFEIRYNSDMIGSNFYYCVGSRKWLLQFLCLTRHRGSFQVYFVANGKYSFGCLFVELGLALIKRLLLGSNNVCSGAEKLIKCLLVKLLTITYSSTWVLKSERKNRVPAICHKEGCLACS